MAETDPVVTKFINVVLDIFRIGSDDGAVVMVIGIREFFSFIRNAGIKDLLDPLTDEPGYVTVRQLGRITFRLAGDGFDTKLIHFMRGSRSQDHPVFQFREKGKPEGIIFVHVQDSGNTDLTSFRLICFQWFIAEKKFVFIFEKVRDFFFVFFFSESALTTVSADELTSSGETVDGQAAVVGTALAFCHGGRELELIDLFNGKHGCCSALHIAFTGDQCSTESTHDTGDIRTDRLAGSNLFKASKDRIVIKGSSLDDDVTAQFGGIGNLDYFI